MLRRPTVRADKHTGHAGSSFTLRRVQPRAQRARRRHLAAAGREGRQPLGPPRPRAPHHRVRRGPGARGGAAGRFPNRGCAAWGAPVAPHAGGLGCGPLPCSRKHGCVLRVHTLRAREYARRGAATPPPPPQVWILPASSTAACRLLNARRCSPLSRPGALTRSVGRYGGFLGGWVRWVQPPAANVSMRDSMVNPPFYG